MNRDHYDAVVLGTGGMGSAALYHLAKRGLRVCGFDRFGIAHDRGSSHGDSRVIRRAYFEHPDYVPLLERTYELWSDLAGESGSSDLMIPTGIVVAGESGSAAMTGQARCYAEHDLPHERWTATELHSRYPEWVIPSQMSAFSDPQGGILQVEKCVATHIDLACAHGASLFSEEPVIGWEKYGDGLRVWTAKREVCAGKLIITSGAWAVPELAEIPIDLQVVRRVMFWFECGQQFHHSRFPCFFVGLENGASFYGIPSIDDYGIKVAQHSPCTGEVNDPALVNRELEPADLPPVREFMRSCFPTLAEAKMTKHVVCMYTMSPDEHFIIDHHPANTNVVLAAGFSGHGFKFAPIVGEVLADLAIEGTSRHEIGFLGLGRFH